MITSRFEPFRIWAIGAASCAVWTLIAVPGAVHLQLRDTYFVIAETHVAMCLALLLLAIGGVYQVAVYYGFRLRKALFLAHLAITLIGAAWLVSRAQHPGVWSDSGHLLGQIIVLAVLGAQILFIVHLFLGFTEMLRSPNSE